MCREAQQKQLLTGASFTVKFVYTSNEDSDINFRVIADAIAHQLQFNEMKHKDLKKAIITLSQALSKKERQAIRNQVDYVEKEPYTWS